FDKKSVNANTHKNILGLAILLLIGSLFIYLRVQ
ncbi:MAG: hypothetical protein ACI95T_001553, partial [Flavobacteriales bacterium]